MLLTSTDTSVPSSSITKFPWTLLIESRYTVRLAEQRLGRYLLEVAKFRQKYGIFFGGWISCASSGLWDVFDRKCFFAADVTIKQIFMHMSQIRLEILPFTESMHD